jgi:hypothetical protein
VPAWEALQSLITLLKTLPPALVAQDHIGLRRPSVVTDLPRLVVSVSDVKDLQAGIGGIVGSHPVSSTSWASDTGVLTSGIFTIEVWAGAETTLVNLATKVFGVLEDSTAAADNGFGTLAVQSVGPMDATTLFVPAGTATALLLPVGCAFSFEAVTSIETGPDGIIKQVQADVHELDTSGVGETMNIP